MDFELSDEQNMLRDSVARFAREKYDFAERQRIMASATGNSEAHWATFAEMGWLALPFAEEDGGLNGTVVDMAVVAEALGAGLTVEPLLASVVLGGKLVEALGTPDQRGRILPALAEGKMKLALAQGEPTSRYHLSQVTTTARAAADGYVLNGHKSVVLHAASADVLLVVARTAGDVSDEVGISVFLVPADAKGIRRQDYMLADGQRVSDLWFEDAPAELLGAETGAAFASLETVVNAAMCVFCAEAVGAMRSVLEMTRDYTATRNQFGKAIGDNQIIQHRLVDMFTAVEEAKALTDMTAMRVAQGHERAPHLVSAMKVKVGEAARFVGAQGVQLHGGIGMTDAYPVGHYFKRLMVLDVLFGDVAYHLGRYADAI